MTSEDLFDCNCMVGKWAGNPDQGFLDREDLARYKDTYGVKTVMAYHALARYYDPKTGNEQLGTEFGVDAVEQCWVVMPNSTGEFCDPYDLTIQMKRSGVRAVRLFPREHGYALEDWVVGDLLTRLEKGRVPTFVDFGIHHWKDPIDWTGVSSIARAHPNLPLVILRLSIGSIRNLYGMLRSCENVHFELSYYQLNRGIEDLTRRFGASKMIFGTGAPIFEAGCPLMMLKLARINEKDRQRIAAGNMAVLLKGCAL